MTSDSIDKASIRSNSSVIIQHSQAKHSLFSCCGCSRTRKSNGEKGFLKRIQFFKAQKRQSAVRKQPTANGGPIPELVNNLPQSTSYLSKPNALDSRSFADIEVASSAVPELKPFDPNTTPKSLVSRHFSSPTTNLSAFSTPNLLQKLRDKNQTLDEYYQDTTLHAPLHPQSPSAHSSSSNSLFDKSRSHFPRHRSIDSLRRSQRRRARPINDTVSSESSRFNLYVDEDNILRELVQFNNDIDLILTRMDMENENLPPVTNPTISNGNLTEESCAFQVPDHTIVRMNEDEFEEKKSTRQTMRTDINELSIHTLLAHDIDRVRSAALTKLLQLIPESSNSDHYETLTLNKLSKLPKPVTWKNKRVFGVPLRVYQQRTGHILPLDIQHAFEYVLTYAGKSEGLFRKPGAKSKIDHLRAQIERNDQPLELNQFNEYQPFVVADVIRQYFRELPECFIPPPITRLLCDLFKHFDDDEQLLAIRYVFLLLPDETREGLEILLRYLLDISSRLGNTPTTYRSLARIFLPSIFQSYYNSPVATSSKIFWRKWKKDKSNGIQQENERLLLEQCLMTMITHIDVLSRVPKSLTDELQLPSARHTKRLNDLVCDECNGEFDLKKYTTKKTEDFLQRLANTKFKTVQSNLDDVHLSIHKGSVSSDSQENLLPTWKCSIDIPNANVKQVQQRILAEQYSWEKHFAESRIIEQIDRDKEILQYVYNFQDLLPVRSFCEFRYSKKITPASSADANSIVISSLSIDHSQNHFLPGAAGITHDMHYYITPSILHPDHVTVTQIASADYSGRSSQWYENTYGLFLAQNLISLRETFAKAQVFRV